MKAAIALAARGLGETWPNPSVGCVLVRADGRLLARTRTAVGGRPHAETQALALAGAEARGATAYITLEPCAHHATTPSCADALIAAGIARVAIACKDPDPRTNGAGIARLRHAGVEVAENLCGAQAAEALAGFFTRVRFGRPLVTLKLAATLDGRIATAAGESQWITGTEARRAVHALRGRHDAVMTGIGTVLADDPALTCRLPGFIARPRVRVVADTRGRLPPSAKIVTNAGEVPTWSLRIACAAPAPEGVTALDIPEGDGGIDLHAALQILGARGMTSLLVEGGGTLAASLLRADLVDRIVWFQAPAVLGADALASLAALNVAELPQMPRFLPLPCGPRMLGEDVMVTVHRRLKPKDDA